MSNWIKYAAWEESQKEIQRLHHLALVYTSIDSIVFKKSLCYCRARSVYERALDIDHRNITLWLKYAELEMR